MSYVARRLRARIALVLLSVMGLLGSCSDNPGGPCSDCPPEAGLLLSDPVSTASGAARVGASPGLASVGDEVAYVSLTPGTVPGGALATIRRVGDAASIITTVRDGGFDPVAIGAQAGDSIEVVVRDNADATVAVVRLTVKASRPPVVVRTQPPRKKTDVPLNSAIIVVFSEPVDEATLTSSTVRLFRGPFPVSGAVRLLQGSGATAAFLPTAPLNRNADYRLVVTRGVRDLDGDALDVGVTVAFTTGQSSTGPAASISLSPDTVRMSGTTYQMTATVRDTAGNELVDQLVTWATSDPNGLTVSPTGLLTAQAAGSYYVTATVDGLTAYAGVFVSAGPPAWVQVVPAQATVGAAGDTIALTAAVRDATGRLLDHPSVTWTSSDVAVATVAADSAGSGGLAFATVTGVSLGSVTITATSGDTSTSGAATGRAAVTVTPPPPVASVTITPESARLLVQATRQLAATVRDGNGRVLTGRRVTWALDNAAVATVDTNGLLTAVAVGSAGVIATSESVSDTAAITVTVLTLASLSSSGSTTCGVTPVGDAYCWGLNNYGQLGDGSTTSSTVPVPVAGGLTFSTVSAGNVHTCGVTTTGAAYCWGANESGQLGTGSVSYTPTSVPVPVTGGLTFSAITVDDAASGYGPRSHTCGLTTSGAAYCWGFNLQGQLGDGSPLSDSWKFSPVPVAVTGGLTFAALTTRGTRSCGLIAVGAAYCWGSGFEALIPTSSVPVAVSGGLRFVALTTGAGHICGLTTEGAAYCWGYNDWGWLGDGSTSHSSVPVAVTGGLTFSLVSAGGTHTCGLTTTGAAYCWGLNRMQGGNSGLLGTGSDTGPEQCGVLNDIPCSRKPVAVVGGLAFTSLSAGSTHTCGVTVGGVAYCWGWSGLGNGTTTGSSVPVKVAGQP